MYAVVESGGKQYRVEQGSVLLVDRLAVKEGEKVILKPVMFRDKDAAVTPDAVGKVKVEAKVTGHVRGDKIRVFKYKAKKGYSRRAGHRAELTELEIVSIGTGTARRAPAKKAAEKGGTAGSTKKSTAGSAKPAGKTAAAKKPATKKPAATGKASAPKKTTSAKTAASKKSTSTKAKGGTAKKASSAKKAPSDKSSSKETKDGS